MFLGVTVLIRGYTVKTDGIKGFCTYESAFLCCGGGLKSSSSFRGCGSGDVDGILTAEKFNKLRIAGKT